MRLASLDRKLLRDLGRMKMQAVAVSAVLRATRLPPASALAPPAPTGFARLGATVERAAGGLDAK